MPKQVDRTFDRYRKTPWDQASDARIKALTADTLASQPEWLIDELSKLHTTGQLAALTPEQLKTHVVAKAVTLDGGRPAAEPPGVELAPA